MKLLQITPGQKRRRRRVGGTHTHEQAQAANSASSASSERGAIPVVMPAIDKASCGGRRRRRMAKAYTKEGIEPAGDYSLQ